MSRVPSGAVIVLDGAAMLVLDDCLRRFSFVGWGEAVNRSSIGETVSVLTPPTTVAALRHGFVPVLHESAFG
jgi:hypothetical protein